MAMQESPYWTTALWTVVTVTRIRPWAIKTKKAGEMPNGKDQIVCKSMTFSGTAEPFLEARDLEDHI